MTAYRDRRLAGEYDDPNAQSSSSSAKPKAKAKSSSKRKPIASTTSKNVRGLSG